MPKLVTAAPNYRKKSAAGRLPQAVVTLNGRDHYLGLDGSKASRVEYDRLVKQWLASDRGTRFGLPAEQAAGVSDGFGFYALSVSLLAAAEGAGRVPVALAASHAEHAEHDADAQLITRRARRPGSEIRIRPSLSTQRTPPGPGGEGGAEANPGSRFTGENRRSRAA